MLNLNTISSLDLDIEANPKRGRRKKAETALNRNSAGPFNQLIFIKETSSSSSITIQSLVVNSQPNN